MNSERRRICFVTGTRAEFGLMKSVLRRIKDHPKLALQIVATGMHLDKSRGSSLNEIKADGWKIDAIVPWEKAYSQSQTAVATGRAMAGLVEAFDQLASDIVLVVGDRVEAFAAASAAHIGGRLVAHIHGGDRRLAWSTIRSAMRSPSSRTFIFPRRLNQPNASRSWAKIAGAFLRRLAGA